MYVYIVMLKYGFLTHKNFNWLVIDGLIKNYKHLAIK